MPDRKAMSDLPHLPVILLGARVPDAFMRRLASRYELIGPLAPPFPETVARLPQADADRVRALITMGTVRNTREAMATLPALGLVSCIGSGYEGVDLDAARERGIADHRSVRFRSGELRGLAEQFRKSRGSRADRQWL